MREAYWTADFYAEKDAESQREEHAKDQAEQEIIEREGEIQGLQVKIRELLADWRQARRIGRAAGFTCPHVCAAIREQIRIMRDSIREARERIDTLKDDYWAAVN